MQLHCGGNFNVSNGDDGDWSSARNKLPQDANSLGQTSRNELSEVGKFLVASNVKEYVTTGGFLQQKSLS